MSYDLICIPDVILQLHFPLQTVALWNGFFSRWVQPEQLCRISVGDPWSWSMMENDGAYFGMFWDVLGNLKHQFFAIFLVEMGWTCVMEIAGSNSTGPSR